MYQFYVAAPSIVVLPSNRTSAISINRHLLIWCFVALTVIRSAYLESLIMKQNQQSTNDQSHPNAAMKRNTHCGHIASFCVGMTDREISLTTTKEATHSDYIDSQLVSYKCSRYDLWDIHRFVEDVLATDKDGFEISTNKKQNRRIKQLSLGRYFPLIRSFITRIPEGAKLGRYIALFLECVHELQLHQDGFTQPGAPHRPGLNGAELFNVFLALIRKKPKRIAQYIKAVTYVSNYDERIFLRLKEYVDRLFLIYSRILVIRLDLEYTEEWAPFVTLSQAQRDIGEFISRRRFSNLFENCIGFIVAREKGESGGGYHFHAMLFFDGHKQRGDIYLAQQIGENYWSGYITRISGQGDDLETRGRYFNCNAEEYEHDGIGMVSYSDEIKRTDLLYALLYLTKKSQDIGQDGLPKMKTITRANMPPLEATKLGRPRQNCPTSA